MAKENEAKPMAIQEKSIVHAKPEPISGLDMVVYVKQADESGDGQRILFQTEAEFSEKAKSDSEVTKDGAIVNMKGFETELSCTSYIARNSDQLKKLTEAYRAKKKFDVWLVDMGSKDGSSQKYKAEYFQGYFSEIKRKAAAEDKYELEATIAIEGTGKFGDTALPALDEDSSTGYNFKEVKAEGQP